MAAAALGPDLLPPRSPDTLGVGAALALLVHGLLIIALAAGVRWRQQTPEVFSAELWAALPQAAAPRAVEPDPLPTPTPPPAPAPTPTPAAPAAAAPPKPVDIAIERDRERAQRAEAERQRQLERDRERERKRLAEAQRLREAEAELLRQQRELQQKRQAELARKAEEARREKERRAQEARLEAQRQENLKRILGQAGASGGPAATGSAARDAAPSAAYAGMLIARIKPNIVLTEVLPPSLEAQVEVRTAPSGTILARRLLRSSGNKDWDEAVLRAIDRTASLPRDKDGRVPPTIVISFRPE